MTFDATVGGVNANSFVSLADIAAYFESSLNSSKYSSWDDDRKKLLAVSSTKQICWYFEWIGVIANVSQALPWPRKVEDFDFNTNAINVVTPYNGYQLDKDPLDGISIPQILKDAVCEMMLILDASSSIDLNSTTIDEIKVGPINIKFGNDAVAGGFSKQIIEMLRRIGTYTVKQSGGFQTIKLER